MFGLKFEEVAKICETIVTKKIEAANKGMLETVVQIKGDIKKDVELYIEELRSYVVNSADKSSTSTSNVLKSLEKLHMDASRDIDTLGKAIEKVSKTTAAQLSSLQSIVSDLTSKAASTSASDNFDAYMQRLSKTGQTFEKVMALVESGEHARTEMVRQIIKTSEQNNIIVKEVLGRIDVALGKMSNAQVETEATQRQILSVVKELTTNLTAAITMEEPEDEEDAPVKSKKPKTTRGKK